VSRSITRPLARLAGAADGIASGDYTRRAPVEGDAELRQLAASFNHMAGEVEAGTQLLEDRVARRTRELRDAQDSLVRKERLAILGQLASGVGHELRNPLGVMTNAVFFLEATIKDPPPKVAEYLAILRSQVALSEKIVSDLLDFARVKPPIRERVAMRDMLETQLARLMVPEEVAIERVWPPDPQYVSVDPVQIGQVILNLATNAVQAIAARGTVTLTVERNGAGVRLAVSDTGGGIAPEDRDKVFEPLFTTKARGIGLGLAVSRALTESNQGRLTLERTSPEGTTFVLELPAADPA
jgi:signal transduction histidine kinase